MWNWNPRGEEERLLGVEEFRSKIYISLRNWGGHVLILFFSTCQSVGQAADGEWAGVGTERE